MNLPDRVSFLGLDFDPLDVDTPRLLGRGELRRVGRHDAGAQRLDAPHQFGAATGQRRDPPDLHVLRQRGRTLQEREPGAHKPPFP
jgi:hypothetical protein